jgi:hypothetical protein
VLDEISDIQAVSQLATVLRYVRDGKIQKRSLGFTDVGTDRSADDLFSHEQNGVSNFILESKPVAQTYDGASITSGQLNGLQNKVFESYPQCMY